MTTQSARYPNRLRECIKASGYKMKGFAQEVDLPLRTLFRYCSGELPIPKDRLEVMAQTLGYARDYLVPPPLEKTAGVQHQRFWYVPHQRNPFFLGRETLLQHLYKTLHEQQAAALTHPQALCGLGGVGKTQLALEYAYRFRQEYEAVFWIKADSRESIIADFTAIVRLLHVAEHYAENEEGIIAAFLHWLQTHTSWLLIFDNADDLTLLQPFLPTVFGGHLLFTTRAQSPGRLAQRIDVECMTPEIGALFLLRRAGILPPHVPLEQASLRDRTLAFELVEAFGGLPLALDQAGAYLEETAYHLDGYIKLYHRQRAALLKRRGGLVTDHPDAVATTWELSFTRVEQANPLAAKLLRLCAFLDPDAIPEEILLEGLKTSDVAPLDQLRLNEAIEVLLRFSLVKRNAENETLTIHRLVQAVIQDAMEKETRRYWIEKVVSAIYRLFPKLVTVDNWHICRRCLPHVQISAFFVQHCKLTSPQIAQLFNQAGYYLKTQANYEDAEQFYQKALTMREQLSEVNQLDIAQSLYNLARLYVEEGKYDVAEQYYVRGLHIRKQFLEPDHEDIAQILNSLALLYWFWGKYEKAEPLYQEALRIRIQRLGVEHPETAHCLNNLALLYATQGKYEKAEQLHRQAFSIRKKKLPADHLDIAQSLQNLASLYYIMGDQKSYEEAEKLYLQSLIIREKIFGTEHPQTARTLHNLALLYEAQGRFPEAEQLYLRVLATRRQILGPDNPKTIEVLENYTSLLRKVGRYEDAVNLDNQTR